MTKSHMTNMFISTVVCALPHVYISPKTLSEKGVRNHCLILIFFMLLSAFVPAGGWIEYEPILQFPFEGNGNDYSSYTAHEALDLNEKGHIIGRTTDGTNRLFFWSKEKGVVLLDQPGNISNVYAVNNHDQIAGDIYDSSYKRKAALWDSDGTFTIIGTIFGDQLSALKDINDHGTAVGHVSTDIGNEVFIRTSDGQIQYLGISLAYTFPALFINNSDQIAGFTQQGPFRWDSEEGFQLLKMSEDMILAGDNFRLVDLSESGRVVVSFRNNYQLTGTYFWDDPNLPQLLDANPLTDLNMYDQRVQREMFDDGQYGYYYPGNCISSLFAQTIPFAALTPDEDQVSYCRLYFDKINNRGQILTNGMEPYISCLWEPKRINFEDSYLVDAITSQLSLETEPNYLDVIEMTHLNANNREIESLAGVEYAFNLEYLDVRNNPLNKRSVCYTLEMLRRRNPEIIILYDTDLYDDNAVEFGDPHVQQRIAQQLGLAEPNYFDVQSSRLRTLTIFEANDLSGLENIVYLQELTLDYGIFSDINDLSELHSLSNLSMASNPNLSDITPLINLPYLKELVLSDCSITNIQPLLKLENLEELNLENNPIDPVMRCELIPQILENNSRLNDLYLEPLPYPIYGCSARISSISHMMHEWLANGCSQANAWCGESDINKDGKVDLEDLSYIAYFWLQDEAYW